jgi:hypothetical protein
MIREIRKKIIVLGNRLPFAQHTKDYIDHLERIDWIYMNLALDGSPLTRDNVEGILQGEMVLTGRIMDHVIIERLDALYGEMYDLASRDIPLSSRLASRFAEILADGDMDASEFRKSTPTLQQFSYTPVLAGDIGPGLDQLMAMTEHKGEFDNPFAKAANLHNAFMAIWPFRENNEIIARALMEYYLIRQGFPVAALNVTESEYNSAFVQYTKDGSSVWLADHLMRAVRDRLELLIQLTAY